MAANEIKQSLRKLEFPFCAREALCRIEMLSGRPGRQQMDLQMDLIAEFIFGDLERKKRKQDPFAILELQLIDVLCDFFESPGGNAAVRNAVFLSLFPADSSRQKTLGTLVSLCISTGNKAVLNAAGIWIQQLGPMSPESINLAKHILQDFFVYIPNAVENLKVLPTLVPHFTANLLTAISEVYAGEDPPIELLRLVGDWISDNPNLLLAPLLDSPALPNGCIPMTPMTPIAGLFRWSILSPVRAVAEKQNTEQVQKCYSKIQQLLMDSVLRLKNTGPNNHAISAQHLANTVRSLSAFLQTNLNLNPVMNDLSLERLAQAVSAAMSANCIYGNKQELLALLQPLSFHHFLIEWTLQTYASKAA